MAIAIICGRIDGVGWGNFKLNFGIARRGEGSRIGVWNFWLKTLFMSTFKGFSTGGVERR